MRRQFAALLTLSVVAGLLPLLAPAAAQAQTDPTGAVGSPDVVPDRSVEPIILTGDRLPGWFSPAAEGHAYSKNDKRLEGCGAECEFIGSNYRSAHNGTLITPPAEAQTGVEVNEIVGYRFEGDKWIEIPIQVDERFPYFLANGRSDFSFYSHTDKELSYAWDVEQWARTAGTCEVEFPSTINRGAGHVQQQTMEDPVPSLDADDEVVFMADDAGEQTTGPGPQGTGDTRQEISIVDPRTGEPSYVYLFTNPEGPSFDDDHYVTFQRDDDADDWIDRNSFEQGSTEQLGSSNTGYGPNLQGTVCSDPDDPSTARASSDRFPRDGVRVSTDAYEWYASGRWMIRSMRVADPEAGTYGPDLIDRWKGRAFQQSPDSSISLVGFEDEQVNWEANSATLGWLEGPVRAIREIWGADSGTNVTKTETFYRDAVTYRYRVRVHPIPPDGLYTSWDYNHDVATCYFNESHPECVAVDGQNDDAVQIDRMPEEYEQLPCDDDVQTPEQLPYGGGNSLCIEHAYFDATDPRHSKPLANLNWEQVSGAGSAGSLVYMFEMKNAQSLQNPLVVPYYRDDACLDDGTGDDPTPRPWPGEASFDNRVYGDAYDDCDATDPATWTQRQGCFACHGVHYFITGDTDNSFTPLNTTEIDGQQWQWAVPTSAPEAIGAAYANTVKMPLVAAAALLPNTAGSDPAPMDSDGDGVDDADDNCPEEANAGQEDADDDGVGDACEESDSETNVAANVGCDPIDPASCLLPFPNDYFMGIDPVSGERRIQFNPLAMPRNGVDPIEGGIGKPIDPIEWNRNDGFSPGQAVMTLVPGLDLHQTWGTADRPHSTVGVNEQGYFDHHDHIADIGLYQNSDAPMAILEVADDPNEVATRHPFWSELDQHPDAVAAGEQLLMLRPAKNFEEGTRYIVALRNLKDASGSTIAPPAEFEAFKSGEGSDQARQMHFNQNIFPILDAAGINKNDLYLAWDFTIASEENLAGRMLHMRDVAFGLLGDTVLDDNRVQGGAPKVIIDSTEMRDSNTTRRVRGRVEVPNFLDRIQQTTTHVEDPKAAPSKVGGVFYADVPAPGSRLLDTDLDGLPDQNPAEPTVMVPFVCDVPLNGKKNIPGLYGHGLLGDRDQVGDFNKSPRRNGGNFMGCAADWWGMSTVDIPTVATILADFSNFPSLPDRAQQGFLNFLFIGRAAVHPNGFASKTEFQDGGASLIKTADDEGTYLVYDDNSQGGIMGGSLVAISPDISRGILGVLGMNYSTLLNRSVDWEGELEFKADLPAYSIPFYTSYQDPVERQIVFGLMQMLWDRGEANGYAHHMTDDPYPNTPTHEVMLQAAFSDHQVANVSAEVEARTIGAPTMTGLEEHWSYDTDSSTPEIDNPFYEPVSYPHSGSALIYWDSNNALPPNGNIPPSEGGDPHGHPRDERAASWQEAHFLLTGEMYDVCAGGLYYTDDHPSTHQCAVPSFPAGDTGDQDGVIDMDDNCPGTPNADQADADGDGIGDACEGDQDGDSVIDDNDNCPDVSNAGQEDADGDGTGDACDNDVDGDGVGEADNCPAASNPEQIDTDSDGLGDACDPDDDNDVVEDGLDNCPAVSNTDQANHDGDPQGDACDDDADGDATVDSEDNCVGTYNPEQVDLDGDGAGDGCDDDDDDDTVNDDADNCPRLSNTGQEDSDGDGVGNACEGDQDSDTVTDDQDNCPENANIAQTDSDEDGLGDACDDDNDGDTVVDADDNCPAVANSDQADADEDGTGDACEADSDGDGVSDDTDNCPNSANPGQADANEDGTGDACEADSDGDGVSDDTDNCPQVANPGQADANDDGQGNACEADSDGDGVSDDTDNCPQVANANQQDTYGDARGDACEADSGGDDDTDGDGDTVVDADDNCPAVANSDQTDADEDGTGDACEADSDGDGVSDDTDNCPNSANPGQADANDDGQGNACEADSDGDGVSDDTDNCPQVANANQLNTYGDARGDACEAPSDGGGSGGDGGGSGGGGGGGGSGGGGSEPSASPSASPSSEPSNSPAGQTGEVTTSIAASGARVRYGTPFTLSGSVDAARDCASGLQVDITRRIYGTDSFDTVATMDVNGDLTWTYTALGDLNASYVATVRSTPSCPGMSSSPVDVLVKAKVAIARLPEGCEGSLRGRVLPANDGRVRLQRRVDGTWKTVSADRLNDRSRFALNADGCGLHRIVFGGSTTNLATAKELRLRG